MEKDQSKRTIRFRAVNRDIFYDIKNGIKTTETRAGSPSFQGLKIGDELVLSCSGESFKKKIKKVLNFSSVKDIFDNYDIKKVMPKVKTLADAEKAYYSYPGYKEKIKKYGILAFELE